MDTVLVKPKNEEELQLITSVLKRMNIRASVQRKAVIKKNKEEDKFLTALSSGIKEVNLHNKGKLKLKSWEESKSDL